MRSGAGESVNSQAEPEAGMDRLVPPRRRSLSEIGENDPDVTIFQQPWWLEAASNGHYRSISAGDGDNAYIWLPYMEYRWMGTVLIGPPPMTHTLGPVIRLPEGKTASQTSQRRKLTMAALGQLPPALSFRQTLDPDAPHAFDFLLAGCEVGVRYTYRLEDRSDTDALWAGIKDKARNAVRRALGTLAVDDAMSVMQFYEFYDSNLRSQGRRNQHDSAIYHRLSEALSGRGRHMLLRAVSRRTGDIVAAAMLIWDARTLYNFRAAHASTTPEIGGSNLLVWESFNVTSRLGLRFDFDSFIGPTGAMFIDAFGASPAARLEISRRSIALKAVEAIGRRSAAGVRTVDGARLRRRAAPGQAQGIGRPPPPLGDIAGCFPDLQLLAARIGLEQTGAERPRGLVGFRVTGCRPDQRSIVFVEIESVRPHWRFPCRLNETCHVRQRDQAQSCARDMA